MYVKDYREVPSEPGGADGLTIRWVINASQGATNFAMRVFELEPGKSHPSISMKTSMKPMCCQAAANSKPMRARQC